MHAIYCLQNIVDEETTTRVNEGSGEPVVVPSEKINIGLILGIVIFIMMIIIIVAALVIAITAYKLKVQHKRKSERNSATGKIVF